MKKFHFNELLIKIELKMQKDRNSLHSIEYMVIGEAISQVCQENEVFFLTGSKMPV